MMEGKRKNVKNFINPDTGKEWWIEITDNGFLTCLNNGKIKETICKNDYDIMSKSMSAMNAQMKKGFIYRNIDAQPFEAISHVQVSNGYTGFMPIGANSLQDDFYIVGIEKELQDEYVLHILPSGEIVGKNSLGDKRLSFNVSLLGNDKLYMNNNYRLDLLNTQSGELEILTDTLNGMRMILDGNDKVVLYYDGDKLVLSDGTKSIWEKDIIFEKNDTYHFSYFCFGTVSNDGKYVLYRCKSDGYYLVDVETKNEQFIENQNLMAFFLWDNKYFVIGDKYYSVKDVSLQCEDLLPFPLPYKTDIPQKNIGIISNGKYIAVRERCWEMIPSGNVQIWDCEKMELLATITDEFIVKDFSMAFAGNNLIIYSDYGVVSVYSLEK